MKKLFLTFLSNKFITFEIVCLVLVTFTVYFGTLDHDYHLDDQPNISQNSFIQISTLSLDKFLKAAFNGANNYRPVANVSFALNYYFHGMKVRGYHVVNIVVHLLSGIFLFYFLKTTLSIPFLREKYGETRFIPFFTALIWLVHPLHTQSVTYIVQRMNSMAAMFFIMSMLFYVKARLSPEKAKKIIFFSITFVSGLLAFGTKQNTVTLPFFILLFEWYFFQNLQVKISRKQCIWIIGISFVFIFILYLFLGGSPLSKLISGYEGRPFTLAQRLLTQPRVLLHYISLIVFPFPRRLNLDYDFLLSYSIVSPIMTLFSIMLLLSLLGLGIYFIKNNRLYTFCIFWFLGNLAIESTTIPLEIIFEHRTYLPSMMTILLLVMFFHQTVNNKKALMAFLILVTHLFSYWTYERNKVWKDELTLWADNYKKSPNKARVNYNLGAAHLNNNKASEAIPFLQDGLSFYEKEVELQQNVSVRTTATYLRALGEAYKEKGELQKAIFYLNKALEESFTEVDDIFTYYFLGQCYGKSLRPQEAVFYFSKALELAKVYEGEARVQATVDNIIKLSNRAKLLLKAQKERRKN